MQTQTETEIQSPFLSVSAGIRRRADGVEIRRMSAPAIRDLFRHAFSLTVPWWIAFNADGTVMGSHKGLLVVGGPTVKKATESVARHERKIRAAS